MICFSQRLFPENTTLTERRHPCFCGIFVLCSLYSIRISSFVFLSCILPFVFTLKHATQTSMPPEGFFFWFCLCTLSVLLCPDCPGFCLSSLLYSTHMPNIHASVETRNPNPSRRVATDVRPRPLGHWDRPSTFVT